MSDSIFIKLDKLVTMYDFFKFSNISNYFIYSPLFINIMPGRLAII